MSASCGLCGKASIDAVHLHFPRVQDDVTIPRALLSRLLEGLEVAQPAFTRTGGLHAAALFDSTGTLIVARKDVGRHNAVDKVIGHALIRGLLPLAGHILLVSGRASFEIVQKALGARIPIVAAVSAPSSLAVEIRMRQRANADRVPAYGPMQLVYARRTGDAIGTLPRGRVSAG